MHKRKLLIAFTAIIIISFIGLSAQCGTAGEAPAIELEIYDGPDYSIIDHLCYFYVAAIPVPTVTGSPEPEIDFSKDDNVEELGSGRGVKVGVKPGESYTLTATAANRYGTASVSIVLEGE